MELCGRFFKNPHKKQYLIILNPLSPGSTYMVRKMPIFFSSPGLQRLKGGLSFLRNNAVTFSYSVV